MFNQSDMGGGYVEAVVCLPGVATAIREEGFGEESDGSGVV